MTYKITKGFARIWLPKFDNVIQLKFVIPPNPTNYCCNFEFKIMTTMFENELLKTANKSFSFMIKKKILTISFHSNVFELKIFH